VPPAVVFTIHLQHAGRHRGSRRRFGPGNPAPPSTRP